MKRLRLGRKKAAIAVLAFLHEQDEGTSLTLDQLQETLPKIDRHMLIDGIVRAQSVGGLHVTIGNKKTSLIMTKLDVASALEKLRSAPEDDRKQDGD
jgi:hypothetical protein